MVENAGKEPRGQPAGDDADGLDALGLQGLQCGRADVALELIGRAIALRPNEAKFYNHLGLALSSTGKSEEAAKAFARATQLRPEYVEAFNNLGTVLRRLGKIDEAIDAFRSAVAQAPTFPEAFYNLGNALGERRSFDDSIAAYRRAIELRPGFAEAYSNLGVALKDTGDLPGSIEATRKALLLRPDLVTASNLLCTLHYSDQCSPEQLYREHLEYDRVYARAVGGQTRAHANLRDPNRRLKIGYASPDLSGHAVGRCLLPVVRAHDHGAFEIHFYSDVLKPDAITQRLKKTADVWRDTSSISDARLAELITAEGIDILVDLAAHTNQNRLAVFARKPAPVQVTWLGMPTTTGLGAIDYRFSDPYLDPPTRERWLYSEATVCLPNCFWCYEPPEDAPEVNELPALRNGFVTFGCLNAFCKVTPTTLDLWARCLMGVKDSRLLLMAPEGGARRRVSGELGRRGIDPTRLEFVDRLPHEKYLALYQRIDLGLDTFPYSGHTTSLDALWMGVPFVTLAGELPSWRAGVSILCNVGLPGLVAETPERLVELNVGLAGDVEGLARLRKGLRGRMGASAVTNGGRFARDLEAVYRGMWGKWCSG